MRKTLVLVAAGIGLAIGAAALRSAFAEDAVDDAFDSPVVKELGRQAAELKLDDEIALLKRIQRSLDRRLLTPEREAWTGFDELRGRSDAGLARILQRGLGEGIVTPRGGGAYWSFSKQSNSYDQWPQLELQKGQFSTGFYGSNSGFVVLLVGATLTGVDEASVPEALRLPAEQALEEGRKARRETPKAEVGGVYAVRAVMIDECDVLAAFQVVSMDAYGATIAWRLLRTYDVPTRKR